MGPLTFSEDVERRRRSLFPLTSAATSPDGVLTQSVQTGQALPLTLRQRAMMLRQRAADMEAEEPDLSQLQEYARQQGEAGGTAMLNALAAQYAGEDFQPVQAQFLKRAAAAADPMRIGSGLMTPQGQYIRDPFADRARRIESLERQAQGTEQMALSADNAAAARDRQAAQDVFNNDMRRMMLGVQQMNAQTARMNAGGNANRAPAGYQWTTGPDGAPALTHIPGGPADPQTKAAGAPTEDERKAAGWFFQADNARRNIEQVLRNNPSASFPTVAERVGGLVPMVGNDLANYMRPDDRQRFVQAASSMSEALLRAATGAGVTRDESEQKVRELTPQLGDRPEVVKQKLDSYAVYMDSLRTRAGRALPANVSGVGGVDNDPLGLRRNR